MPDFTHVSVDRSDLVWDFKKNDSNYVELRRQALARDIRFNYLTTFADLGAFGKSYNSATGPILHRVGTRVLGNLADLYFAQALANDRLPEEPACPPIFNSLSSDLLVCEDPGPNELDDLPFVCRDYSDIAAAMIGMHPARTWLTRLELDLPREALAMDCLLSASATQTSISHLLEARRAKNVPESCEAVPQSRVSSSSRPNPTRSWLFAVGVGCALILRRLPKPLRARQ
jgi:hypothetical protein